MGLISPFTLASRASASLFTGIINGAGKLVLPAMAATTVGVLGVGAALGGAAKFGLGFNNSIEQVTAQLNAFTKDGAKSAEILDMIKKRAQATPYEFEEMARSTSMLMVSAKLSGVELEKLVAKAEILGASNPVEGIQGAAYALREAVSGDFVSLMERFNIPRSLINSLKKEGLPNIEIVSRAMAQMGLDTDLVANLAQTAEGRWSTFKDTMKGVASQITQPIFDVASGGLGKINEMLAANKPAVDAFATDMAGKVKVAVDWLTSPETISGIIGFGKGLFDGIGKAGEFIGRVWEIVGPKVSEAFRWFTSPEVQSGIRTVGNWLLNGIAKGWEAINTAAAWIWPNVLKPALDYFGRADVQKTIFDGVATAWQKISDIGVTVWEKGLKPFGEWLANPANQAAIGAVAGHIGGALANGLKMAAENLPLVVAGFAAWKVKDLALDIAGLAISVGKWVLAMSAAQKISEAPSPFAGIPGGAKAPFPVPGAIGAGGAAAAAGGTVAGSMLIPVVLMLGAAVLTAFAVTEFVKATTPTEEMVIKARLEYGNPTQIVKGIESAVNLLPIEVPVTVKPTKLDINEWGDVKLPPKDFGANPKLLPPEGGWDKFRGSVQAGVGPVPIKTELAKPNIEDVRWREALGIKPVTVPALFDWGADKGEWNKGLANKLAQMGIIKVPAMLDIQVPDISKNRNLNDMTGGDPGILRNFLPTIDAARKAAEPVGVALPQGMATGVATGTPTAKAAVTAMSTAVINACNTSFGVRSPSRVFMAIGGLLVTGLVQGLVAGAAVAVSTAQQVAVAVITKVRTAASPVVMQAIGMAAGAGFAQGIGVGMGAAVGIAQRAAQQIIAVTKAALAVKSPSRIFEEIGRFLMQGLGLGIAKGSPDALKAAADAAQSVVSVVSSAFDVLTKIGGNQVSMPGGGQIDALFASLDLLTAQIGPRLRAWTIRFTEASTNGAKNMGEAVSSIGKAIEPLIKLGDPELTLAGGRAIDAFFDSLDYFVRKIAARVRVWGMRFSEETKNITGYVGDAVANVGKAIEPLTKLGNPDLVFPGQDALGRFFDSLDIFIPMISGRTADWWTRFDAELVKVAGYIGDAVANVGKAIEPLVKLGNPDMVMPGHDAIRRFFDGLDIIVPMVSERVADWWTRFDADLVKVAGWMGDAVAGMGKAIEPLTKLGNPDMVMPTAAAMDRFFDALDLIIPKIQSRISDWWTRFDADLVKVSGYIGQAVSGTLAAIDPLMKLANPALVMPAQGAINKFFDALDLVVPMVSARAAEWWTRFDKDLAAVAGWVGQAVSGMLGAVDPLQRLANPALLMPSAAAMDRFFDALDLIIPQVQTRAQAWAVKMTKPIADTAGYIGSAVSAIGQAIDPLTKIAGIKELPTAAQIDAFFWKLEDWLNQFNKRAELWAGIATEKTAKLGGWIGDIAAGIGKAIEPLLKMAEAQKVTPGQIEGAMSNVWVALDQFNKVMTGGTDGTPFEGAWMDRAKAFAASAGSIFEAITTALGALSGTGGAAAGAGAVSSLAGVFSTIREQWAALFGPATTEGTILFMLFDHTVGFFKQLEEKTLVVLAAHKLTWLTQMDNIITALRAKFEEMSGTLVPVATSTGTAIGDGIAAGITASIPAIEAAARDAAQKAIDAAKAALGIASPSKRAADEVGLPFTQGVALGIDRGAAWLAQSIQGLTGQMMAVSAAGIGASAYSGFSGPPTPGPGMPPSGSGAGSYSSSGSSYNPNQVVPQSGGGGSKYAGAVVIAGDVVMEGLPSSVIDTFRERGRGRRINGRGIDIGRFGF